MTDLHYFLGGLSGVLTVVIFLLGWRNRVLGDRLSNLEFQNRSQSVTYGKITEQWFPLMEEYPYDPQGFRFLGSPIDGVQFEDDRIVFVEFKANTSRLAPNQRRVRELVEAGEVYFEEFRFTASTEL
jgi:predicted Holliday junction resolvase-like endonuclease